MGFKNKGEKMCKTCTHNINRGQKNHTISVFCYLKVISDFIPNCLYWRKQKDLYHLTTMVGSYISLL
jgi:hypothetical protein